MVKAARARHPSSSRDRSSIGVRPTGPLDGRRVRWRRDDSCPDRRPRPGRQAAIADRADTDPPVHPLQSDVPGSRRPQPDRQLRRRAVRRPGDRGPRLVQRRRSASASVVVVGGGVAGLEAARVAAIRGHHVAVFERASTSGAWRRSTGPGAALVAWLEAECRRSGVEITTSARCDSARRRHDSVHRIAAGSPRLRDRGSVRWSSTSPMFAAVRRCRRARSRCSIRSADRSPSRWPRTSATEPSSSRRITSPGNELSRTGDLAPANVRLAQCGAHVERRTLLRAVRPGEVEVEDRFSGERRTIACAALVDCGFRLPTDPLPQADLHAGDCVAPRTIYEAVLEGRRAALAIDHIGDQR